MRGEKSAVPKPPGLSFKLVARTATPNAILIVSGAKNPETVPDMPEPTLRELKSRAQQLKPAIHLGKAGPTPEFMAAFGEVLDRNQLVKLRFEAMKDERKTLSKQLADLTGSVLVQQVGHTAVFFRSRPRNSG